MATAQASAAATPQVSEERELTLVKNVEMKFALAESDSKFQRVLHTYLAPLLLKFDSPHLNVRTKTAEVCKHINVRLVSPEIKIPVEALLRQAKLRSVSQVVRNLDMSYISKGISRLSTDERVALLPAIISGIRDDFDMKRSFGAEMLNMFFKTLIDFELPLRGSEEDNALRSTLSMTDEDAGFLAAYIGKLMILNLSPLMRADYMPVSTGRDFTPGLTNAEHATLMLGKKRIYDEQKPGCMSLVLTKTKAVSFLASGAFTDFERFIPAICAAGDVNSNISEIADGILKRSASAIDVNDPKVVRLLYSLYKSGTDGTVYNCAPAPVRIKVLSYLTKSSGILNEETMAFELIDLGLRYEYTDPWFATEWNDPSLRELTLMRDATMQFANAAIRLATQQSKPFPHQLLRNRFLEILIEQGWPRMLFKKDTAFRQQAYDMIGTLNEAQEPHPEQFTILDFLLHSYMLDTSGQETSLQIQRALLTMMRTFWVEKSDASRREALTQILFKINEAAEAGQTLDSDEVLSKIEPLIAKEDDEEQMKIGFNNEPSSIIRSAAYIVNRYANRCLPFNNNHARWINISTLGHGSRNGVRPETLDEARRGLDPHWFLLTIGDPSISPDSELLSTPGLSKFLGLISKYVGVDDTLSATSDPTLEISQIENFTAVLRKQGFPLLRALATFLRQTVVVNAFSRHKLFQANFEDVEWRRKLESSLETSEDAISVLRDHLRHLWLTPYQQEALLKFYSLLIEVALRDSDSTDTEAIKQLERAMAYAPSAVALRLTSFPLLDTSQKNSSKLWTAILSNSDVKRISAARIYGLLQSLVIKEGSEIRSLSPFMASWKTAVGMQINVLHGQVVAQGYLLSRLYYRNKAFLLGTSLDDLTKLVLEILNDAVDITLKEAAFLSLGQLCAYGVVTSKNLTDHLGFDQIISKISISAKKGNERAIATLGRLSLIIDQPGQEGGTSILEQIEKALYALHEIRETESQFAVGEAISILACGWESSALAPTHDVDGPIPPTKDRTGVLERVIDNIIADSKSTKPTLKRAAVVWLLCVVQFCGHHAGIKNRLRACQDAFKHCLSDKEELVQEAASRGLGLVYDKGDRNLKDDLVRDLVGSFTDNKAKLSGNVTEETELFEPGALPTGEGKSVSTYKDVISLAQEVGDPGLVYRFMSLAANNSIWSSRAAFGRFGLSSVFSDSSVDGYLAENPKLYPKLYRYRFDPNPNVRRSMQDIWNALVKDSNATVNRNFDAIMEDLLQNMLIKEWRVREASCNATSELIQGRTFEKIEPYITRVWAQCFKVLDDIKGSVRISATALAHTLTSILVRSLEAGDGSAKKADAMLKHVLPFLFSSSGLEASAEEVVFFSIDTLLQIIKKSSGAVIRPYIPELVERLLNLFSSLEPQVVNYLRFKAGEYKLTEQEIDDKRLVAVRQSPLMEALERSLDLTDNATMEKVAPKLENAIKTALGLPSQVACTRLLVALSTRHNQIAKPYADRFLKLVMKNFRDRNDTVAVSYAESAGYIARIASDEQILELFAHVKRLYFDSETDKSRIASSDVVHAVAKHAADRFAALGSAVYPLVFVAKHDGNSRVKETFEKVWSDNVGASRAALLYITEIVELAQQHLDSPRWALKHASARAVAAATEAAASRTEGMPLKDAELLWPALVKTLNGKTWDGKEVALIAFTRFVEKGSQLWRENAAVAAEITKIVTREAKRQNTKYRPHGILALGKVAASRSDISMLKSTFDIISPVIESLSNDTSDDMDVDDAGEGKMTADLRERTLANGIEALQDSLRAELLPKEGSVYIPNFLSLATVAISDRSRTVASAAFDAIRALSPKLTRDVLDTFKDPELQASESMWQLLSLEAHASAPEAFRLRRAQAAKSLLAVPWNEQAKAALIQGVSEEMKREHSNSVKQAYGTIES